MGIIHRRFSGEIEHCVGTKRRNPETEALNVEVRLIFNRKFYPQKPFILCGEIGPPHPDPAPPVRSAPHRLNVSKTALSFATKDPLAIRRKRRSEKKNTESADNDWQ